RRTRRATGSTPPGRSRARSSARASSREEARTPSRRPRCRRRSRGTTGRIAGEPAPTLLRNRRGLSRPLHRRPGLAELVCVERPALERIVARGDMAVAERVERRLVDVAPALLEARAARVEAAGAGRVERARHVALENEGLPRTAAHGVRS